MKRRYFFQTVTVAIAGVAISSRKSYADSISADGELIGHGDYRYRVHRDWANVNTFRHPILNCHETVPDKRGRLFMIGDHPDNNIFVFDRSGEFLDAWGTRFPGGYGLTLLDEGEEHLAE